MELPSVLRVVVVPIQHIFEFHRNENGETDISGMEGAFLKILSSFVGFKYDLVVSDEYGVPLENGTWTGIMGALQKSEADVGLSISLSEGRSSVAQFSKTYGKEDVTFVVRNPDPSTDDFWFIHPLDSTVWGLIFVSLVVTSVALSLTLKSSFIHLFITLLSTLLKQPFSNLKPSVLLVLWLLVSTILTFGYSAVLFSYLTLPPKAKEIRNFEDLAEAVHRGSHRCYAVRGSIIVNLMRTSKQEHIKSLIDVMDKNDWFVDNSKLFLWKQMEKNTALIFHRFAVEMFTKKWGSGGYRISRDVLISMDYAMALRKGICCIDKFNKILSKVESSAIRRVLWNKELLAFGETHEDSNDLSEHRPIKFENIKGLIIGISLSYVVAVVVLSAEVIYFKRNQN